MSAETDATLAAESHLDLDGRIRRRAHEIYLRRGGRGGSELDDWLEAEREIVGGSPERAQNRATVIGSAKRPGTP